MRTVFFTKDLLSSSHFIGTAQDRGETVDVVATPAELLQRASTDDVKLVILDLSMPGVEPRELVAALREHDRVPAAIVAFAPHVHEAKLAAAQEAGCDEVLSRGAFHREMGNLLDRYANG